MRALIQSDSRLTHEPQALYCRWYPTEKEQHTKFLRTITTWQGTYLANMHKH